jgi:hypothetical protein
MFIDTFTSLPQYSSTVKMKATCSSESRVSSNGKDIVLVLTESRKEFVSAACAVACVAAPLTIPYLY